MNITFDYSDLLHELKDDLSEGILSPSSDILIERESIKAMVSVPLQGPRLVHYNAIVDWYYLDEDTNLDDGLLDDFTPAEKASLQERIKHFISVKDKLETITVEKCMNEMNEMSKTY